jgi:uncharacterized damage-inducible protein DinB
MDTIYSEWYSLIENLHNGCKEQLEGLTQDELDWAPGEGMNSMAVLAAHIAGSETFWIGDIVKQTPTGRDRPAEFVTSGVESTALFELLDGSLARIHQAFESLSPEQLDEPRESLYGSTVASAIGHLLEHTAMHLGHMQVTRQLLALPVEE